MGERKRKNHFLVEGSILAAASIISRIIGLLYRIPMTRIVGDQAIGYYSHAFEIYSIALLLSSYSIPLAVSKLTSTRNAKKEYRNSNRVFICAMLLSVLAGIIMTLAIFFGADFLSKLLYETPDIAIPLRVLAPTILVLSIMGVFRGLFQGKNTMLPTSVSQILEQVVNAIVSIVAAYFMVMHHSASDQVSAYGAAGGTLGTLVGAFFGLLFLMFTYMLYRPIIQKKLHQDKTPYRESYGTIFKLIIFTAFPIILSQVVNHISNTIDSSMFHHIMDNKTVTPFFGSVISSFKAGTVYDAEIRNVFTGIYANKYITIANVPISIASAMAATIVPTIALSLSKERYDEINGKVKAVIKFNMLLAIPSTIGIAVLASPILQMLFGDGRKLPAYLLTTGAISIVFFSCSTVTSGILQGINKMKIPLYNAIISLVLHVGIVYVLLSYTDLGIFALVIGNVSFGLTMMVLNWISIQKYMQYRQEIIRTFLIPFISAVIMGAVSYFIYQGIHLLTHSNAVSCLSAIMVAVVVYAVLIVFLKAVDEEEIASMPKGHFLLKIVRKLHLL